MDEQIGGLGRQSEGWSDSSVCKKGVRAHRRY